MLQHLHITADGRCRYSTKISHAHGLYRSEHCSIWIFPPMDVTGTEYCCELTPQPMDVTAIDYYSTQHHRRQTLTFAQFRFFINFLYLVCPNQY